MILETVFGVSLYVQASLDRRPPPDFAPTAIPQISSRQREAALLPLVRRATECIVRGVKSDPRYGNAMRPGEITDLIIEAIPGCEQPLRTLIDTHDRMYGDGSGEAFFMGPYLDVLPAAVAGRVKINPAAR